MHKYSNIALNRRFVLPEDSALVARYSCVEVSTTENSHDCALRAITSRKFKNGDWRFVPGCEGNPVNYGAVGEN